MSSLTTSIGDIVRGDREVFPPYLYAAYQSTRRRDLQARTARAHGTATEHDAAG